MKEKSSGITLITLLILIVLLLILIASIRIFVTPKNEVGETSKENTVMDSPKTDVNELKAGDYVLYDSGLGGKILCRVLYETSSPYGLQIITNKTVKDITLGGSDLDSAKKSYNNATQTLNQESEKYINPTFASDARSVGSNPIHKNDEVSGPIQLDYSFQGSQTFDAKKQDTYYETDLNAMKAATSQGDGIHAIGEDYWLASRRVVQDTAGSFFRINGIFTERGVFNNKAIFYLWGSGKIEYFSQTCGLRPCITLKSEHLKIIEGNGSSSSPCILQTK